MKRNGTYVNCPCCIYLLLPPPKSDPRRRRRRRTGRGGHGRVGNRDCFINGPLLPCSTHVQWGNPITSVATLSLIQIRLLIFKRPGINNRCNILRDAAVAFDSLIISSVCAVKGDPRRTKSVDANGCFTNYEHHATHQSNSSHALSATPSDYLLIAITVNPVNQNDHLLWVCRSLTLVSSWIIDVISFL